MRSAIRAAVERAWWQPQLTALAAILLPLSWVYRGLWYARKLAFKLGLQQVDRAPVPVVVVGNLIVGGAGKTPTVMALVEALRRDGWTPGVVSRGHGSSATAPLRVTNDTTAAQCGDEPLLIRRRTGVPVWTGRRRAEAARKLCQQSPEVDIVISDDGLQHLALERDTQVIVFDGRGIGNGHLLPAGPLREPMDIRPPPRSAVIYNAAAPSAPWAGHLARRRLSGALPLQDWWAGAAPSPQVLAALRGHTVLAAAGLAEPERFFTMLESIGLDIKRLPLPDHASFDPRPWPPATPRVIVTEKDAVKLRPDAPDAGSILVVTLDFELPEEALESLRAWLAPLKKAPISS